VLHTFYTKYLCGVKSEHDVKMSELSKLDHGSKEMILMYLSILITEINI
jgi:hypothetical protein